MRINMKSKLLKAYECKYSLTIPTHRCGVCGAYWKLWKDKSWSLLSKESCEQCEKDCNHELMFNLSEIDV